jgi:hypothetical protein
VLAPSTYATQRFLAAPCEQHSLERASRGQRGVSNVRSSMLLLGIAVIAMLIGALRLVTEQVQAPTGSSTSAQPDGALALSTWLADLGADTHQLAEPTIDPGVGTVVILQPPAVVNQTTRDALDAVADRGGTIVVAGNSVQWLVLARALGVNATPATTPAVSATTRDGLSVPLASRYRLSTEHAGAEPLLVRDDGEWVALTTPYRQGKLIVIASPEPLTNAGLADDATARFVYREVVSPAVASGAGVAFDEIERSPSSAAAGAPSMEQLLYQTPGGRAILYGALVTFVFLLLGGRRLGPPLYLRSASEAPRTMYEHVQMLANLYRRAGHLRVVRETLSRAYARQLARGTHPSARAAALRAALERVDRSRTEADLVAAVAAAEDAH